MDLTRDSFVATAMDDITQDRTRTVTAAELVPGTLTAVPSRAGDYTITETFGALWNSLTLTHEARAVVLSVMRGIQIEPRHPAYRVSETGWHAVHQSQVGDDVTLVFKATDGTPIWLAVLHTR